MTMPNHNCMDKIINPDLALAALHSAEPYGEFKAFVRLAETDNCPAFLTEVQLYEPGVLAARIQCSQIEDVAADDNVISIELREHVAL